MSLSEGSQAGNAPSSVIPTTGHSGKDKIVKRSVVPGSGGRDGGIGATQRVLGQGNHPV